MRCAFELSFARGCALEARFVDDLFPTKKSAKKAAESLGENEDVLHMKDQLAEAATAFLAEEDT